jgi:hypothetical protein
MIVQDNGTGDGLDITGNGSGNYAMQLLASNSATNGINAGSFHGTLSTLTTYTGNTPQTGDSYAVVNNASYGNAKLLRSTTPANTLSVDTNGDITFNNSSIGSVSGAVASVTGNVGGNVAGSVASVTGAVEVGSYALHEDPATLLLLNPNDLILTNGSGYVTATNGGATVLNSGTAQSGASTTIKLANTASSTSGLYVPNLITITGGTDAGDVRNITIYNGSTVTATVNAPFTTTPDNTSVYQITPWGK